MLFRSLDTSTDYLLGQDNTDGLQKEFDDARVILARNASKMSKEQKMELINLLM